MTARNPRSALRRISAAPMLGIGQPRDAERDDPVGVRLPPLVVHPVVERPGRGQAELGVGALRVHPSAEAGDHRREAQRRPHAVDVHVARPGRRRRSTPAASGRSGTAPPARSPAGDRPPRSCPTCECCWPSNSHTSWPAPVHDDPRRPVLEVGRAAVPRTCPGGSTRWSSTEMIVAWTSRGSGSGRNSSGSSTAPF